MTLRSIQLGIYTLVIVATVNTVGNWAKHKLEDAGTTGTRTQQLCQIDSSYCK